MSTPQKTLLVEKITYSEEALGHLREQLKKLVNHIEIEYQKITQELEFLESKEGEISEDTFNRISNLLQNAWERAMSARSRLKDLDDDFNKCDKIMENVIIDIEKREKLNF